MKMWLTKPTLLLVFVSFLIDRSVTAPSDSTNSLVVSSTRPSGDVSEKEDHSADFNLNVPQIYQMQVKSNISNRFAHTTVRSKVKNLAKKAQEATFSVILPESAFISGFIMEIDGKNYTAYVKEKEEAKKTYDNAVASGLGAAHVAVSARDSSRFTVSVNVEPESKASFYLIYEELLKRQDGHYELVVNLHPGQPVKDLSVEVVIAESRKITSLKAPPLRSGNEIGNEKADLDPRAEIEHINDTAAIVKFSPNLEGQKEFAQYLGTKEDEGLSGQFVVQYDVEREPTGGEVFIQDGYFVHFFAPSELTALPKYVVFILDTSSSMDNQKIQQLKEAMHKILEQLNENDLFHLVEFNSYSKVWNLDNPSASISVPDRIHINEAFEHSLPKAYPANADNIKKSKNTISNFRATAATDIHTALMTGLRLVRVTSAESSNHQPMIIFLTDGGPTNGITSTEQIIHDATKFNTQRTPIYALSFGDGADKNFLQKLALRNSGFSKHIYEAADASLQLEGFYRQISSPLLANVTFKYQPSVTSLTKTEFPIYFGGSELIVAGWSETADIIPPDVDAWNGCRLVSFHPTVERSVSNVERLWAYLTVKQLLEKKEISDEGVQELKRKALDLALKYSFVTSVSSLVVVKPNATNSVDTEAADKKQPLDLPSGLLSHPNVVRSSVQPESGGSTYQYRSSDHRIGLPVIIFKMWLTKPTLLLVFVSFLIDRSVTAPSDSTNSLVVSSTRPSGDVSEKEDHSTDFNLNVPQIYQMQVKSNISNRFAHTTVTSKVKNLAKKAQEATFSVILPESAFISGFIMEIEGNNYTAYVKEKEEAKKTYDNAVASGLGAAHVAVSARDSSRFTVSVNVEPESKASFYLIYEELLKRQDGHYELVVNLHPGQPVKDLSVEVVIAESRKITSLKAPPLRSGNEIGNEKADLDPRAEIEHINDTAAIVKFSPNLERQKEFAQYLGTKEDEGLSGQFIVQYDVEREPTGGEVFIQDGYFVHFFAPSELTALPKYVVFILDTSSSMYNQKIQQLKEAMHKILEQLNENDLFHLVEFNSYSKVWNLDNPSASISVPDRIDINEAFEHSLPKAYPANADNIKKSKNTISNFRAIAATDIHTALMTGLRLVRVTSAENSNHQPMIIFLTDGEPTNGITSTEQIIHDATKFNTQRTPIYALSFGDGADKNFLQKLALRNSGFSKHIYEAADASLQLEGFYRQISSPLLANVTFKYQPSVTSLTKTDFPIHFGGSELIVAGRSETADVIPPDVNAWNGRRHISFRPTVERSVSNVERLWAYLTVKQLLEKKEISDEGVQELKKKALDLALKYSFVTSVSSLVVVKPNATKSVDTEAADKKQPLDRPAGFISHNVLRSSIQPASRPYPSHRQYGGAGSPYRSSSGFSSNNFESGGSTYQSRSSDMSRSSSDTTFRFGGGGSGYRAQSFSLDSDADQMTTESHQPDIFVKLPWLRGIFNQNGTISLSTGVYNLGLGEIISGTENCPKTPNNTPGYCTLLSDCEEVHSALTSISIYENHFCVFRNEYAGVCCPNMIIHRIPFQ